MSSNLLANDKVSRSFRDVRRELSQLKDAVESMENLLDEIEKMVENDDSLNLPEMIRRAEHNLSPQFMQNPAHNISIFGKQVEERVYSLMIDALKAEG